MPNYLCGAERGQTLCLDIAFPFSYTLWTAAHTCLSWGCSKQLEHWEKTDACCALLQDHRAHPSPYSKPQQHSSLQLHSPSGVADITQCAPACLPEPTTDTTLPSVHWSASHIAAIWFNSRHYKYLEVTQISHSVVWAAAANTMCNKQTPLVTVGKIPPPLLGKGRE